MSNPRPYLYHRSPEVHAAVQVTADIAIGYGHRVKDATRAESAAAGEQARDRLFQDLVRFFETYDRFRAEQIESLKLQLTEAMRRSVTS